MVANKISTPGAAEDGTNFRKILDQALKVFFKDAVRVTLRSPSKALHFIRTVRWQQRAVKIRSHWEQQGVHVPPIMILVSPTDAISIVRAVTIRLCVDRPKKK